VLEEGRIRLENCPFRELAVRHRSLVCALNHTFLTGVLDGRAAGEAQARALAQNLGCCVEVVAKR
jgi:predicted ArsR family transcriptional regulator